MRNIHQHRLFARIRPLIDLHIKEMREARGMKQIELAALSDIPLPTLSHIESGHHMPRLTQMVALSLVFNCPLNELVTIKNEPQTS